MAIGQERASAPGAGAPPARTTQAGAAEASEHLDFDGQTEASKSVQVHARATGWLTKVSFAAGTAVKQGEMLAQIDPRPYQAELAKQEAEVQLAQARVRHAAALLQKGKAAMATGAVGVREDLDRLAGDVEEAQAVLQDARTGLELAKLKLSYTDVVAPISGTIGRPLLDVGNLATADQTLLATIVSTDPIYVAFDVDERTYLRLRRMKPDNATKWPAGLPALCGLADEEDLPRRGVVEASDNQFDATHGTTRWRALVPNPRGLIVPGMYARVRLLTAPPQK
jgi:RND family efflux transporter MFP subunit